MNPTDKNPARRNRRTSAFSLVELMIAMGVLSIMLLFFAQMTEMVTNTWSRSESRVETYQNGRASLELVSREMTPAVVDTRMQFAIGPGEILKRKGEDNVAENSHCALWMAPLGPGGDLRCVGYYLYRDDTRQLYRLKRIYMKPDNGFFPKISIAARGDRVVAGMFGFLSPIEATSASWFTDQKAGPWTKELFDETNLIEDEDEEPSRSNRIEGKAAVSTVADGVIALWFQSIDLLGNPIPWVSESSNHPPPRRGQIPLYYNSAAYFTASTSTPFNESTGESFIYMAQTPLVTKAHRVPAAVDITVVTLDERALVRNPDIPIQENILRTDGTLDLEESIRQFKEDLLDQNVQSARTFTTRVKLVNGS